MKHYAAMILLIFALVLLIAALPSLFSYGRPSVIQYYSNSGDPDFIGKKLYKIHFHPDNIWKKPLLYMRQIKEGTVFDYREGKTRRNWLNQAPRYFKVSLSYLCLSGVISLLIGIPASLLTAEKKRNSAFYEFLSFMTVLPDFILIFLIQFLFFYINKAAGGNLVRIYTSSASDRAVFLPLLILSCYPVLYILRTTGSWLKDVNNQQYITFARSKGLSARQIRFFHVGPAAIHYIKGDLHKILAILFSNLFITELMFNNKGITSFLFNNISQYSCTVNTILMLLLLYLAVYICLFAVLQLIGIIFRRGLP